MPEESSSQSDYANQKLEDSQSHLQQAGSDLKTAAGAKLDDLKGRASDLKDSASAKLDDLKSVANAKLEDLKGAASAKAEEYYATAAAKADEFRGQAEAAWGDAKVKARSYHEDGEQYVRENPTRALLIALGAGFMLGLIVRK